jgi:hypothetical protein
MSMKQSFHDFLIRAIEWTRRLDPYYRDAFDRAFRAPLQGAAQFLINLGRPRQGLAIAEEKELPGESDLGRQITEAMKAFLDKTYRNGATALRAGNTKTYGVVKGAFRVEPGLPPELRLGLFAEEREYPAYVRFAGPGPLAPPDPKDNGILSLGLKVMDVPGEKLSDDEMRTQDFTCISSPTFTTPDARENSKLQRQIYKGTPLFYFINPFDSHILDGVMQALYSRLNANPLDLRYWSCAAYLFGKGRAIQYTFRPSPPRRSKTPRSPSADYLREAMAARLRETGADFDFLIQFQSDAHRMPVENASVVWPERMSPYIKVATLHIPKQVFDSPGQLAFDRNLSINPWHSLPEHRPLGSQNRVRRMIYLELSKYRQRMNQDARIEPTGREIFR